MKCIYVLRTGCYGKGLLLAAWSGMNGRNLRMPFQVKISSIHRDDSIVLYYMSISADGSMVAYILFKGNI